MDHRIGHSITAEVCRGCGSLNVRTVEPRWFVVGLERENELRERDAPTFEGIEFGCRDCGSRWN